MPDLLKKTRKRQKNRKPRAFKILRSQINNKNNNATQIWQFHSAAKYTFVGEKFKKNDTEQLSEKLHQSKMYLIDREFVFIVDKKQRFL